MTADELSEFQELWQRWRIVRITHWTLDEVEAVDQMLLNQLLSIEDNIHKALK